MFAEVETFEQWRAVARELLVAGTTPQDVHFLNGQASQPSLFGDDAIETTTPIPNTAFTVPPAFLELARYVACHRDGGRWHLLYRVLWRITHGESHLLKVITDDDVHSLVTMQKSVSRDAHKMKAFVRFRKVESSEERETFVAWHRPDHRIVRLVAPFFARRFKAMDWTILTPDESVTWDRQELIYGPGAPVSEAPDDDALEELWKTYYASIFNPARVKVAAMKREMPVRFWAAMPETELIEDLLKQAPAQVENMIAAQEGFADTAARFMPNVAAEQPFDIDMLRQAAARCQACDLHQHATQTVFGVGPTSARVVIVGEQPGDREDIEGQPFVGPAGELLDHLLEQSGISRDDVYITNAVKHFKYVERGQRRLHKKPNSREIFACRPWLEAELNVIKPEVLVCLGATAAQAICGRDFRITQERGKIRSTEWCVRTVATWHPAAILRAPDAIRREEMKRQSIRDLRSAVS
jgi:DNA polymerase